MPRRSFLDPLLTSSAAPRRLRNVTRNTILAEVIEPAFTSAERRSGLLSREAFESGHAMIIAPSNAIHTFFMKFPIDVVYVTRDGRVVKCRERLLPWRVSGAWRAFAVIELPAGTLVRVPTHPGDQLLVE